MWWYMGHGKAGGSTHRERGVSENVWEEQLFRTKTFVV
jgi:hypothetical protein